VTAVLGEVASKLSLEGAPICQQNGVPMITPSSTNPKVTEVGDMIFRVCFIDPFQGFVCAKFARENLKAQKAAVLYDQSQTYSVGLQAEFEKSFVKLGGQITTKEAYQKGEQDFTSLLTSIRSTKPDIIFLPGYYNDVGTIATQARKLGITVPLLGGDGWESPKLAEIGGDAINGCFYSNHYSPQDPSPRVQEFIQKYKKLNGNTPDSMAALAYDATQILRDAINRAGSLSGTAIAAQLAKTKAFDGVTGKITIDEHRNAVKSAVILEMKNGVPTYVTTITP
jgi:branched-chain amino acid transport system substrate-binding protein